jgi:radical SAM superfamily enzyme YgiQ (UPF0313 family)
MYDSLLLLFSKINRKKENTMKKIKVTLVNANLVQIPAVAPVALDVLNTSLLSEGFEVELLDLTPVAGVFQKAIEEYFSKNQPDFIGITFRNAWDLYFNSIGAIPENGSFIPSHVRVAKEIMKYFSRDRIIAGGIGFSSMPQYLLEMTGLRFGVVGAGEKIFGKIIRSLENNKIPRQIKGFIEKDCPYLPAQKSDVSIAVNRNFADNRWYYENGGLIGLRTSNGCAQKCAYCIEPKCKGGMFFRNPQLVVAEIDQLVEQKIMDIHFTDSECNLPMDHSKNILKAIIARGYPKELKFWSYAQILPFDEEYAILAEKAGVAGILFSTDHINPRILKSFGKCYESKDIIQTTKLCKDHGILVFHELLFGMLGDSFEKIKKAIDFMRALDPYVTGITVGVGIMPRCPLSQNKKILKLSKMSSAEQRKNGLYCNGVAFYDPTYFVNPALKVPGIFHLIRDYVGSDIYKIMAPTMGSTEKSDDHLVNNPNRVINGRKGAAWSYYRDLK